MSIEATPKPTERSFRGATRSKPNLSPVACCAPVATADLTGDQAATLAALFKALADPARVRIVNLLSTAGEAVCVCELTPSLRLSQGTVSHHLKKLLDAGLLEREQRGVWAYYSLNDGALARLASVAAVEGDNR